MGLPGEHSFSLALRMVLPGGIRQNSSTSQEAFIELHSAARGVKEKALGGGGGGGGVLKKKKTAMAPVEANH